MQENINFYCLGAAHRDIKARALVKPKNGESVPVQTSTCLGGVACNIAVNLASLGSRVFLGSIVGDDIFGQNIIKNLIINNINIQDIIISKNNPTAYYYALIDHNGELFIALSDMNIYQELKLENIILLINKNMHITDWIIDANLSPEVISYICRTIKNKRLWGIGVSVYKNAVLSQGFPYWHALILNQEELFALSNKHELKEAMNSIKKLGCAHVIITAGASGVYYYNGDDFYHSLPVVSYVTDVTGAGDAFSAGVIYSLAHQKNIKEALDMGLVLANQALRSSKSSLEKSR